MIIKFTIHPFMRDCTMVYCPYVSNLLSGNKYRSVNIEEH